MAKDKRHSLQRTIPAPMSGGAANIITNDATHYARTEIFTRKIIILTFNEIKCSKLVHFIIFAISMVNSTPNLRKWHNVHKAKVL